MTSIISMLKTCLNKKSFEIQFIYSYVDDLILTIPYDKVDFILETFNSYDSFLKFTVEIEKDNSIPFLDTKLIRGNNQIIMDWHQKSYSSDRYILFKSSHHHKHIINTLLGLKSRIIKIAEKKFQKKNFEILYNIFKKNGYPDCILNKILYSTPTKFTNQNQNINEQNIYHSLPYIPNLSKLSNALHNNQIKISFRSVKTVGKLYTKLKDKIDILSKNNVVHSIQCNSCKKFYIG